MTKFTDTQAILLAAAAQRDSGSLLPLLTSITAPAGGIAKSLASLLKRELIEQREVTDPTIVHRSDGDQCYGLFISAAGKAAIGVEDAAPTPPVEPASGKGSRNRKVASSTPTGRSEPPATGQTDGSAASASRQTKAALVLSLLQREEGATLAELIAATGWLPHTTRAALTGVREQGHTLTKRQRDGVTSWTLA